MKNLSIKTLYAYALAEGEGVGTAYEYFAKRLALRRWLPAFPAPKSILLAGLPEKYGSSFDFWLLAQEMGASLTIVDDRLEALEKAEASWRQNQLLLPSVSPQFNLTRDWVVSDNFDLAICSEVVQRIDVDDRPAYIARLRQCAPAIALFCPNAGNDSHVGISGLAGLTLPALNSLVTRSGWQTTTGYIDMPPFPPGITRSETQRQQATSGWREGAAMWGLGWYAKLEWLMPAAIRKKHSHIVYAFTRPKS